MVVRLEINNNNCNNKNVRCPNYTNEQICDRMRKAASKIESDLPRIRSISSVDESELEIGKELGEGAYCSVRSVSWKGQRMALKELRPETLQSPMHYMVGTKDLGTEAAVLAGLDHPGIIKLRGISSGSLQERIAGEKDRGFFLLMDEVESTLDQRLNQWKAEGLALQPSGRSSLLSAFQQVSLRSWDSFVQQRLPIALEIAQAMQYLHKKGVMYRDLKPTNVGLDENGSVKLYDFGLATTDYVSRECAGSRRYMAPEIVMQQRYCCSVDVYSFGMLLWYFCTLQKPFDNLSAEEHFQAVRKGERPSVPSWWPRSLQRLLDQCWCQCPSERISMDDVVASLEKMMTQKHRGRRSPSSSPSRTRRIVPVTSRA